MLYSIFDNLSGKSITFVGLLLAFLITCILLKVLQNILPRDGGRAYAVNGGLSQGKPRGAGLVFILVFVVATLLFVPISRELIIYLLMIIAAMMSGYLDDSSKAPWGEYKKGLIDLIIALVCAVTYVNFNGSTLTILTTGSSFELNPVLYVLLAMLLIWVSINVTNCTDGVDGLSGSIGIATTFTFYLVFVSITENQDYALISLLMIACILGYLWFNASPSKLLMGDAGSRAIGLFIAIIALKTGSPLLYIPAAIVFIIDGGLGLVKVALLRFFKIKILANTRTPIHDHVRKNLGWSDTQTVFRFITIQVMVSFIVLYLVL
ncbi:phospho-N-acetylmuramoyl-pentapeptide-transferase [Lachnoclostridium sp.]|uniref:phospho-N-acetylmuramoyl-pentapeptide- transferase n=1 Tax=Lachnoclostridium sp. TaxID=2028282 RepID=UPI00289E71BA|nr:phospho-N-acetylmuramoyl-pentapeptide-transferase [Lachnoclostridium sp.]